MNMFLKYTMWHNRSRDWTTAPLILVSFILQGTKREGEVGKRGREWRKSGGRKRARIVCGGMERRGKETRVKRLTR